MDKIILSEEQFEKLCVWGNNHNAEHTSMLNERTFPIKALKIELPFCDFIIKGFIDDNGMKISMNFSGQSLGSCYLLFDNGSSRCVKDNIHKGINTKFKQDTCYVFTYVLLLMLHGNDFPRVSSQRQQRSNVKEPTKKKFQSKQQKSVRKSENVVYLLRFDKEDNPHIVSRGHHASPSHAFGVRGHFRHYKDGKVVWIESYEKGNKKKKDKVYKI